MHIKAGNYGNENVAVTKSGTAAQPIIFEGYRTTPEDNPDLNYSFGDVLNASIMPLLYGGNRATAGVAIALYSQQYVIFKNFQITNYQAAIGGWNASNNTIENIIAIALGDYNASYDGKGFSFSPNGSGQGGDNNTLKNCIVKDVDNLVTGSEPLSFEYTYSDFNNNGFTIPAGTGNISDNPLFVNEAGGDFHLQAGSPCIDIGTSNNAPTQDFEGTARPQGAGFDLGAYEYQTPLAVEFLSPLQANQKENQILLKWTTTSEEHNDFFLIQRSENTLIWKNIGRIDGSGNSSFSKNYKAYDSTPPLGNLYYRLKQIDLDGTYSYSNIASIFFEKIDFQISPNPSNGIVHFVFSKNKNITITLTNAVGQQIIKQNIYNNETTLDLDYLPNGIYLISLQTKGQVLNKTLLLQK